MKAAEGYVYMFSSCDAPNLPNDEDAALLFVDQRISEVQTQLSERIGKPFTLRYEFSTYDENCYSLELQFPMNGVNSDLGCMANAWRIAVAVHEHLGGQSFNLARDH